MYTGNIYRSYTQEYISMVRIKGIFTGYIMYKEHIQGMHTRNRIYAGNVYREYIQGIFTGYIIYQEYIQGIHTGNIYRDYIQGFCAVYIYREYIYIYIYRVYTQDIYKQGTY